MPDNFNKIDIIASHKNSSSVTSAAPKMTPKIEPPKQIKPQITLKTITPKKRQEKVKILRAFPLAASPIKKNLDLTQLRNNTTNLGPFNDTEREDSISLHFSPEIGDRCPTNMTAQTRGFSAKRTYYKNDYKMGEETKIVDEVEVGPTTQDYGKMASSAEPRLREIKVPKVSLMGKARASIVSDSTPHAGIQARYTSADSNAISEKKSKPNKLNKPKDNQNKISSNYLYKFYMKNKNVKKD